MINLETMLPADDLASFNAMVAEAAIARSVIPQASHTMAALQSSAYGAATDAIKKAMCRPAPYLSQRRRVIIDRLQGRL